MVLMVANAKLSVYVLSLTVLTATLSFNVLPLTLNVSVMLNATLSFNVLPRY